ncbi:MAG: hypothetical protein AAF922_03665 [Pseudomonadota bacterium]
MTYENDLSSIAGISYPPSGAVNTLTGTPVNGPGGRWVPCATVLKGGAYVACLYEVGAGRRQVCGDVTPRASEQEALMRATDLAAIAAA